MLITSVSSLGKRGYKIHNYKELMNNWIIYINIKIKHVIKLYLAIIKILTTRSPRPNKLCL